MHLVIEYIWTVVILFCCELENKIFLNGISWCICRVSGSRHSFTQSLNDIFVLWWSLLNISDLSVFDELSFWNLGYRPVTQIFNELTMRLAQEKSWVTCSINIKIKWYCVVYNVSNYCTAVMLNMNTKYTHAHISKWCGGAALVHHTECENRADTHTLLGMWPA